MHISKCTVHVYQEFGNGNVPTILQQVHPPTWVSLQTGINVRHYALLLILVQPSLHIELPQGICHIHIWIHGFENWHVQTCGSKAFSFCLLLLQCLPLGASLTVEYPSELAPPLSGEDGGEFLGHSLAGWGLGGLTCRWLVGALAAHPNPVSSAGPVLTVAGGHFPPMAG